MSRPGPTKPPANAKPPAAGPAPSLQPTRQLLDELDSLMQRMLALPVNQLEAEIRASEERSNQSSPPEEEGPSLYRHLAVDAVHPNFQGAPRYTEPETASGADAVPPPDVPPAPSLLLTAPALADENSNHHAAGSGDPRRAADDPRQAPDDPSALPGAGALVDDQALEENPLEWGSALPASPEVLAAMSERPRIRFFEDSTSAGMRNLPERSNASVPEPVVAVWLRPLLWCNQVFDQGTTWLGKPGEWLRSGRGRALLGWSGLALLAGALVWSLVIGLGGGW